MLQHLEINIRLGIPFQGGEGIPIKSGFKILSLKLSIYSTLKFSFNKDNLC